MTTSSKTNKVEKTKEETELNCSGYHQGCGCGMCQEMESNFNKKEQKDE